MVEALENGAGDSKAGELLEYFVDKVAGVEIGSDEDVGTASNLVGFGVGNKLVLVDPDAGVDGGVKLHFSGDEKVAVFEGG